MIKFAEVKYADKQKARKFQDTLHLLAPETLNELFDKAIVVKDEQKVNTQSIKFSQMADYGDDITPNQQRTLNKLSDTLNASVKGIDLAFLQTVFSKQFLANNC